MNGKGTFTYADGHRVTCTFKNNVLLSGKGTVEDDGLTYDITTDKGIISEIIVKGEDGTFIQGTFDKEREFC